MTNWLDDLTEYLEQLESTASELAAAVETARSLTRDGAFGLLHEATVALQEGLSALEQLIERRRTLLDREDGPAAGRSFSLRAALMALSQQPPQAANAGFLLARCAAVGQQIDEVREDALALFVCHFHLVDTTSHFLRLILPTAEIADTYNPHSRLHQGGGLLDRAG